MLMTEASAALPLTRFPWSHSRARYTSLRASDCPNAHPWPRVFHGLNSAGVLCTVHCYKLGFCYIAYRSIFVVKFLHHEINLIISIETTAFGPADQCSNAQPFFQVI